MIDSKLYVIIIFSFQEIIDYLLFLEDTVTPGRS